MPKRTVTYQKKLDVPQEKLDEYKEAFDMFDKDHSGTISIDEIAKIMKNFGNPMSKDDIKEMMTQSKYAGDEELTAKLQTYLDAAQKEADYADDNIQKTYEQYIGNFNGYLDDVNIGIANVGSTEVRLTMTQTRVENQTTTVTELKSQNEDRDISDIIIDYYASYYAYQASLTAAGKINQTSLLDYI